MKISFLTIALLLSISSISQIDSSKWKPKVESIDSLISNLYAVISGEKGEERDWDFFNYLFKNGAYMIPSGMAKDGSYKLRYDTPEDYISKSGKWLVENGFFEKEIHRETQQFGNIAHIFTTYECFHTKSDTEPFMRGINSIQLVNDGERWWVVNIYWAQESETNPIPKEYLPN